MWPHDNGHVQLVTTPPVGDVSVCPRLSHVNHTIELTNVSKHFGKVEAVAGVSLTVSPGEVVAFLGPNGAGKTTTIDMVLGLTQPTGGSIQLFGSSPAVAIRAGRVGAMLQTGGLLRDFSVRETVSAIAALSNATDRVDEVLAECDLTSLARRKVSKCSGGEQQRIKFALALLTSPELLILDEPTAGMDVGARRSFWEAMERQAKAGRTVVFATHYLEEAQEFAHRIVMIGHGKLLADAPVSDIRAIIAGRQLEASFDPPIDDAATDPRLASLRALAPANLQVTGDRLAFTTPDSDKAAAELLAAGGYDLTITAPTLESAFIELTKDAA